MRVSTWYAIKYLNIGPWASLENAVINLHYNLWTDIRFDKYIYSSSMRQKELKNLGKTNYINMPQLKAKIYNAQIPVRLATSALQAVTSWLLETSFKKKVEYFQIKKLKGAPEKEFLKSPLEEKIDWLKREKVISFEIQ